MERTITVIDVYAYPDESWQAVDLSGFDVEAIDGEIGSVDEATCEIGADALVVDTGPWIFGKKVMLPIGTVMRLDPEERRVWVDLTREQIENAPEFEESRYRDDGYRQALGAYYAGGNRPAGPDFGKDDRPVT